MAATAALLRTSFLADSAVSTHKVRPASGGRPASLASPAKKKVLVPIGYGTEELEAVILVDVLRRAPSSRRSRWRRPPAPGLSLTHQFLIAGTKSLISSHLREF